MSAGEVVAAMRSAAPGAGWTEARILRALGVLGYDEITAAEAMKRRWGSCSPPVSGDQP